MSSSMSAKKVSSAYRPTPPNIRFQSIATTRPSCSRTNSRKSSVTGTPAECHDRKHLQVIDSLERASEERGALKHWCVGAPPPPPARSPRRAHRRLELLERLLAAIAQLVRSARRVERVDLPLDRL